MPIYNPDIGLISHVQKYSTKDGPGIRNTVFFKGCPLGCLWCSNPELIRPEPDLLYNQTLCTGCGQCIAVCPNEALSLNDEGTVLIDHGKCTASGECVAACPEGALELTGKEVTVAELTAELMKDAVFYQTSGGGVTFSGGEPLYQPGFIRQVAEQLKEAGVHTALDTAGDVSWCCFDEVLDVIDLVLYDLKTVDRDLHRQLMGRDNDCILANLRLLAERGVPLHMRLVVVQDVNDSLEDLSARMAVIRELKSVEQIDLLPYHRYGIGKYAHLGLDYPLGDLPEHTEEQIAELRAHLESYGLPVTVGG